MVYWQDRFTTYNTLENYNSDNGEYSVEEDWEGETPQSYLAGRGTLLYKARTFSDFYASLTFLEPSDRTSTFGITGIICENLMVVYNDPYDRIEVRQGSYQRPLYPLDSLLPARTLRPAFQRRTGFGWKSESAVMWSRCITAASL